MRTLLAAFLGFPILMMGNPACNESSEVPCPPGAARDKRAGDLCLCKGDAEHLVSGYQRLSYPACDPFDTRDFQGAWISVETFVDRGDGVLNVAGRINSDVFCAAESRPSTFIERDEAECEPCACDKFDSCVPAGCHAFCGEGSGCGPGATCTADGVCAACGLLPGQVQCGGGPDGCGVCPLGTMCVEGLCSSILICQLSASKVCDVPEWCPVDVRSASGPVVPGTPCTCLFPANGNACQVFAGSVVFR